MINRWTKDQIKSFEQWHEKLFDRLNYTPEIRKELRRSRSKFLERLQPKAQK